MKPKSAILRVDVRADKKSVPTRVNLAALLGTKVSSSTACQAEPLLAQACNGIVKAGQKLATDDAAVKAAEATLKAARDDRDASQAAFDAAYDLGVAHVEKFCAAPTDVSFLGFTMLDRNKYALAAPVEIEAKYDVVNGLIRIHVVLPKGLRTCLVEISPATAGAASYVQLPGTGTRRVVAGYAPGSYLVRAASTRSTGQSAFTDPVPVIVK